MTKDSRFDDKLSSTPPPSPLRASNTLESLRPRDISWPTATLPGPGYAGAPADVPPELDTDDPVQPLQGRGLPPEGFNLTPVDWPTAMETMGKETIFRPQPVPASSVLPKIAEPVKVSRPKPSYVPPQAPMASRVDDLEAKVEKLEGQVDGLLERIFRYNQKSSHKL